MGAWNNHGMVADVELQQEAVELLALFPEELVALADNAERERWVWTEMAKHERAQKKRKANLIAKFWQHRARRWKELAAWAEQEFTNEIEEEAAKHGAELE